MNMRRSSRLISAVSIATRKRSGRTQCCSAFREKYSKTAGASLGSKPKERFFENARKATVAGHPLTECKWNRLSILRAPACAIRQRFDCVTLIAQVIPF